VPTFFGYLDKPERDQLTYGRSNGLALHPVIHQLIIRDGKLAVIVAAVVSQLDADTIESKPGRSTQYPIRRAFHHFDKSAVELPVYLVAPSLAHDAAILA
jgi:hypothetical protein